jgi:hypothetical protein
MLLDRIATYLQEKFGHLGKTESSMPNIWMVHARQILNLISVPTCEWEWDALLQSHIARCQQIPEYMGNSWNFMSFPHCPCCGKKIVIKSEGVNVAHFNACKDEAKKEK